MKPKSKSVLLTGASGTVGFQVLKQLIATPNLDVTVFDKETKVSSKKLNAYKDKVNLIYGDITLPNDLKKIAHPQDYVIHLAAIIPPTADDNPKLAKQVNVEGTKALVRLLEKHSPNCFFVYSSSISVYGDRLEDPYITVSDPLEPSPGDEYAVTKIAAENILQKSKLDWSIFRLAAIMGGHKMSKLMFHQPLDTSLEIATPQDTARAFVNALKKREQLSKRIFNLGGGADCRISYEKFLERSFGIYGLGNLSFPEKAFAEKNFHCGFYKDGDELERIVHFRKHSLEDYFRMEREKVSGLEKFGASLFKKPIKYYLLKQSEPLNAHKENDAEMKKQFFGE
ncbi:NAD-dependent epimerase/dehydratase family protein [Aequorivita marina]|uniref:NAD-dependent epimerase/dehydratase family protein n=1 Tax=Aequorivita marina TaxID=3073654 RepID=UPI002874A32B|nr:NAD(P)-dependent oxidoreductase [Aequorivita sp. S2608]MDS1299471.1 NAD(P)-dependent oxidoreductase [Aequorivita sp. S2608]